MLLQGIAVLVQRIRGAVQAVQVHRLEVEADQLAQARGVLQPGVRGQLAAGLGHAPDDVAQGCGNLRTVHTAKRIRRDSFTSVAELELAIDLYIAHHNIAPKPFIWTASATDFLARVTLAKAALPAAVG